MSEFTDTQHEPHIAGAQHETHIAGTGREPLIAGTQDEPLIAGMRHEPRITGTRHELYDMHCHLDFFPDPAGAAHVLGSQGTAALCATVTPRGFERPRGELSESPNVRIGVGLHPWWLADGRCDDRDAERAAELASRSRFVAEVGLDFAHGRDATAPRQAAALDALLAACEGGGKVLSIHAVRSAGTVLDLLERHGTTRSNVAILHWFSGTSEELGRAVRLGCRFSVGPRMLSTRRGREYARQLPLDRLLLETDLPGSTEEGRALDPLEIPRQLHRALGMLGEIRGEDVAASVAETSAGILGL